MKYSEMTPAEREQHDREMAYFRERNPRQIRTAPPPIPATVRAKFDAVTVRQWATWGPELEAKREAFCPPNRGENAA